jgi:hydrogenase expression/formation protein HypC
MCLGTVCQVAAPPVDGAVLVLDGEREMSVSLLALTDPVATGDWLLVHCGLALARLSETEARQALRIRDSEVPS